MPNRPTLAAEAILREAEDPQGKASTSIPRICLSALVPSALVRLARRKSTRYAMSDSGDGEESGSGGGEESGSASDDYQDFRVDQQKLRADQFKLVYEPTPVVQLDGGYGWVVVAAAFVVNLISDGVTFSFGILLSELFKSLDDTREDISWINSFLAGVPLLLGPVTSVLIDRFGCRVVTIAGGFIAGIGFTLMYILPRSTLLFVFSAGLLSGLGLGLVYMPAVVAVSFYFVEKRALATGLSVSGSGVGTVVFAYIMRACIEEYTWRGSFLILGGILLNICICGALYRPLEPADLKHMKRMNRLYIQFEQANNLSNSGIRGGGGGNKKDSLSVSLSSTTSPTSSTMSPTSRRWQGTALAAAKPSAASEALSSAKSLLSIPTYLVDELNDTIDVAPVDPALNQPPASATSRFAVSRSTAKQPAPSEQQLIASLKLGYLKRLATMPDNSAATVHTNNRANCGNANDFAVGGGGGVANGVGVDASVAISKANTSHELVDYAHQVAWQQKHERRQQLRQQQQQIHQQEQLEKEQLEQSSRRMSVVIRLPHMVQQPVPGHQHQHQNQHQQQQQCTEPHQQALRPRLNTASQTVRRQLFPVDRRYFMQHTRRSFGFAAGSIQAELWDSCPEFGRIPISSHNQNSPVGGGGGGRCSGRDRTSRVSPFTKLWRRLAKSKSYRDMKFLFTSWDYVSFLASNFLLYFWYDITYAFLPDHAKEIGLSNSDVSLIIALIGVSNTIGQIVIGYIGDFPSVNTVLLYALCMSLTGVANFLVPWCLSLASLLVYGIVYGFLVSANYSLCSIVIIDLFSLERLTTGYGFIMFFQGIANLLGPPTMGHMRDTDSNYNRTFVFSGIFVLASNLLILSMYTALFRLAKNCFLPHTSPGTDENGGGGGGIGRADSSAEQEEAAVQEPLTSSA